MKSDDLKSAETPSASLPAAFSMSSNKRNGPKFEGNGAESKEIVPTGNESETSEFRHVPVRPADDSSTALLQQRLANLTSGTGARKLLQSTISLLNGAAQTARERLAARQVEREARKREREISELRSRLLTFSPESQASQLHQSAIQRSSTAGELQGEDPQILHPDVTSARPEMKGEPAASKDREESTRKTKRGQESSITVAEGQVDQATSALLENTDNGHKGPGELAARRDAKTRSQRAGQVSDAPLVRSKAQLAEVDRGIKAGQETNYKELALRRAFDEIKRKSQEAHAEQQARIKAEQELLLAQAARAKAEEEAKRIAERAEAEQQSRIKAEEERKFAERARLKAEDDFRRKIQEDQAQQDAKLRAAKLERLNSDKEKTEEAQIRIDQQTDLKGEQQRQQMKQAHLRALEEFNLKVQEFEIELRTRLNADEESKQTEAAFLKVKEEAQRKAREAEAEHQARIKAEEERKQTEAAFLKVKEEAERKAREAEAEHRARIKAEEERKQTEAALLKAKEEAERKAREAEAEHQARIKIEQELQLAAETALLMTEPQKALLRVKEEADRKSQEAQAEHLARLKAEEERQEVQLALLKAEDDAKRKAREDELERLARTKIEQELQLARTAQIEAEAEAQRNAEEIEAERQAKLEAERQHQQAEIALLRAEAEAEWRARRAEEEQAKLKAALDRQHAEEMQLQTMAPAHGSIRYCPRCNRAYSATQLYCLFDAVRLVDQVPTKSVVPLSNGVSGRLIFKLGIFAFLGAVILGGASLIYFSSGSSGAALYQEPPKQPAEVKPEGPVLGGSLVDKETFLPSPEYPARAKINGISGKVTVAVVVDRYGTVQSARPLGGDQMLRTAAVEAARKAKFDVKKLVDPPTSGTITYNFKL